MAQSTEPGAAAPTRSLKRIQASSTQGLVAAWAIVWLVALVTAAHTWWHPLLLLPAAVLTLRPVRQWQRPLRGPRALVTLLVGGATWAAACLLAITPTAVVGAAIPVSAVLRGSLLTRLLTAAGAVILCTSAALLTLVRHPELTTMYVAYAFTMTVFWIAVFWGTRFSWNLLLELDTAHRARTELAVVQERFRIAADLHDIQGHTLHVVKLKTALARRLMRADPLIAAEELAQVQELIAETISQSKALAHGERTLTLAGELENAKRLFEADGIAVRVCRTGGPRDEIEGLCSLMLREATTNVLRHAHASRVEITVSELGIRVVNDGVDPDTRPELSGLGELRRRIGDSAGSLHAGTEGGEFTTEARFAAAEALSEEVRQ